MAADRTPPKPGVSGGSASGWSDRFEQGLHPAIERFNASIGFDLELLQEDLDGSIAHARIRPLAERVLRLQASATP
jgi:argininosuccinate lyase